MIFTDEWDMTVGEVVFLYTMNNSRKGNSQERAARQPRKTNESHEEKLHGWCGEINNISTIANGLGLIKSVSQDGETIRVDRIAAGSKEEQEKLKLTRWGKE